MAAANKAKGFAALRKALIDQTGWSRSALSRRVKGVKRRLTMKTKIAQAIVAHGEGVLPDRYLEGAELAEVQATMAKLGPRPSGSSGSRPKRAKRPATRVVSFKAFGIKTTDPFLNKGKLEEAVAMSEAYPVLYVLENSIRTVVKGVMDAKFGPSWWDTELNSSAEAKDMKRRVEGRLKKEQQQSWHQRRGSHKIDYIDLGDLLVIAQSKRDVFFPVVLSDEKWFEALVSETSPSRNTLCHMNPLAETSVKALGVKLAQWHDHLKRREEDIRSAMAASVPDQAPIS